MFPACGRQVAGNVRQAQAVVPLEQKSEQLGVGGAGAGNRHLQRRQFPQGKADGGGVVRCPGNWPAPIVDGVAGRGKIDPPAAMQPEQHGAAGDVAQFPLGVACLPRFAWRRQAPIPGRADLPRQAQAAPVGMIPPQLADALHFLGGYRPAMYDAFGLHGGNINGRRRRYQRGKWKNENFFLTNTRPRLY